MNSLGTTFSIAIVLLILIGVTPSDPAASNSVASNSVASNSVATGHAVTDDAETGRAAVDPAAGLDLLGGTAPVPGPAGDCGELLLNADGTYEMPYSWQYGGVVPPDYGAFAECYEGVWEVCALTFDLVQIGSYTDQTMDIYIWDDEGGEPGAVICAEFERDPGPIAFWPSVSRHELELADPCCTGERWWVGYWPNWPGAGAAWFLAGDLDGFGGWPYTNFAPGIGFPTGWHNVSVAWGPTQAMGAGALVRECEVVPVRESTWGTIKTLF